MNFNLQNQQMRLAKSRRGRTRWSIINHVSSRVIPWQTQVIASINNAQSIVQDSQDCRLVTDVRIPPWSECYKTRKWKQSVTSKMHVTSNCIRGSGYYVSVFVTSRVRIAVWRIRQPVSVFLGAFTEFRIATISFFISVCPSAWSNSAPKGRIFMKF